MPDLDKASTAQLYDLFDRVGDEILIRTGWKKVQKS